MWRGGAPPPPPPPPAAGAPAGPPPRRGPPPGGGGPGSSGGRGGRPPPPPAPPAGPRAARSLPNPQPSPQHLEEGPVQEVAAVGEAPALEPRDAVPGDGLELGEHARLAEAGVARDQEHLASPGDQVVDHGPEPCPLGVAADQG